MSLLPGKPTNIMLMPNTAIPRTKALALRVGEFLREHNIPYNTFSCDFEGPTKPPDLSEVDLLIVVGGDGSLLRAGHLCAPLGIPLLGIQSGRLGFLVELNEDNLETNLERLVNADYRFEKRMMLKASLIRKEKVIYRWDVINEAVICRGKEVRPIEVRVDLNEGYMNSYIADGLIVATPTGSTAYALAAGGPILPPELRNILILPIAAHLSLDRAVVLAEGAEVNLYPNIKHDTVVSIDGMMPITMEEGDLLCIQVNPRSLHMVRFGEPNYFYRNLAAVIQRNPILEMNKHD